MRRPPLILILGFVLAACESGTGDSTTGSTTAPATSFGVSGSTSPTVTAIDVPDPTTEAIEERQPAEPHLTLSAGIGVFAPTSGFIVTSSPYQFDLLFSGRSVPDSVEVDGVPLVGDGGGQAFETQRLDLDEGENLVSIVVHYDGRTSDLLLPITFLEGSEERLGWVASADEHGITVDYTEWESDREFPGPEDPDPGVLSVVPVAEGVKVIVSADHETGYEWFVREVTGGYGNLDGIEGFDEWNPNGIYPYRIIVHDGTVVQLWMIPLG